MFERFTQFARRAIVEAQGEARAMGHAGIRPEHLLLAIARGEGVAASALQEAGVDADAMRQRIVDAFEASPAARKADRLPFTPRAKKSLELALREALALGHKYIGTEHLLLGVLAGASDPDSRVGVLLGRDPAALADGVRSLVSGGPHTPSVSPGDPHGAPWVRAPESRAKVELQMGEVSVAFDEPALVAALRRVPPDRLLEGLRRLAESASPAQGAPPHSGQDAEEGVASQEGEVPRRRDDPPERGEADAGEP